MLAGYCVRRAGDPPPPEVAVGIAGQPVRLLEAAGLGMWVSASAEAPIDASRLREHDAVVRAALRSATPLPLRFGTRFPDEAAVREALQSREPEFRAALERVAGRVEMGLRAIWTEPPPEPPPPPAIRSGTEFLEHRRSELRLREARDREAAEILDALDRHFAGFDLETVREVAPAPEVTGTLAHLVRITDLRRYRARAEAAASLDSRVRLRLSGPWAPYSFV